MNLTDNERVKARLAEIGAYKVARQSFLDRLFRLPIVIEWESPTGLENDLTHLTLRLFLEAKLRDRTPVLEQLLDAWDRFRVQFSTKVPELKKHLIDLFRTCYFEELPAREKAEYFGSDQK